MTLFKKLSKENQTKLQELAFKHNFYQDCIDTLKSEFYWTELILKDAMDINRALIEMPFDVIKFSYLFEEEK